MKNARASFRRFKEIETGMVVEEFYQITPVVYQHFLDAFGDFSPIHVDENAAKEAGFQERVMHGGILNGFLSHFVGMVLPGARAVLLSADLRYLRPSFLNDMILLKAEVTHKSQGEYVVEMRLAMENRTRGYVAARGRVLVRVNEQEGKGNEPCDGSGTS
jgi:acyl dehydratase